MFSCIAHPRSLQERIELLQAMGLEYAGSFYRLFKIDREIEELYCIWESAVLRFCSFISGPERRDIGDMGI